MNFASRVPDAGNKNEKLRPHTKKFYRTPIVRELQKSNEKLVTVGTRQVL